MRFVLKLLLFLLEALAMGFIANQEMSLLIQQKS